MEKGSVVDMKKVVLVIAALSLVFFDTLAHGQGTVVFNNLGPNDGEVLLFNDFWGARDFRWIGT